MPIFKFVTGGFKDAIEKVAVERETEQCVWVYSDFWKKTERLKKDSQHRKFFDTWKEAHDHLVAKATQRLENAKSEVETAEKLLRATLAIKEERNG